MEYTKSFRSLTIYGENFIFITKMRQKMVNIRKCSAYNLICHPYMYVVDSTTLI